MYTGASILTCILVEDNAEHITLQAAYIVYMYIHTHVCICTCHIDVCICRGMCPSKYTCRSSHWKSWAPGRGSFWGKHIAIAFVGSPGVLSSRRQIYWGMCTDLHTEGVFDIYTDLRTDMCMM